MLYNEFFNVISSTEPLSPCTPGGILWSPSLIPWCFYKGRWREYSFIWASSHWKQDSRDGDSRHLARSLSGTGTLKAKLSFLSLCAILSGSQENYLHSMSLVCSCCITPPVIQPSQVNCGPVPSQLVCPTQVSLQYTTITLLPPQSPASLKKSIDFSYASLLCHLLCAENCPPGSSMIKNVLKTLFCFQVWWFGIQCTLKQRFPSFRALITSDCLQGPHPKFFGGLASSPGILTCPKLDSHCPTLSDLLKKAKQLQQQPWHILPCSCFSGSFWFLFPPAYSNSLPSSVKYSRLLRLKLAQVFSIPDWSVFQVLGGQCQMNSKKFGGFS